MKVLIIGQGGREHVLASKAAKSLLVTKLHCAPGNAGMAKIAECHAIDASDIEALLEFAKSHSIDLTIVGPEAPLVEGIVDTFKAAGLSVFGPSRYCSQLEGSKVFAKELMTKLDIPTANYKEFIDAEEAIAYLERVAYPTVIKAEGLAAGKGVVIAENKNQAIDAVKQMMKHRIFGDAGDRIIIEEFLVGEEASLIAIADGISVKLLASSQDHKRIFDGDQGPNTGGMGAYSPAPVVTDEIEKNAVSQIFEPLIAEMRQLGHPFVGFIYAGIMVTDKGIKVLEYNVRFGDPEAQVVLERLDSDFLELIQACMNERLKDFDLEWNPNPAVTVVMASEGYPASSSKGDAIEGIEEANSLPGAVVYHAGTINKHSIVETNGGRVLSVVGMGSDISKAVKTVYDAADKIHFRGMQYRKDIAYRALDRINVLRK